MLAHPACKAGLTHCGFGGTLEFIAMRVPVVTFPHFSDQPLNADQIVDAGAGIHLLDKLRYTMGIVRSFDK